MNKHNLDEVSFMRPVLIVLVVLYHAMAIHTGNWHLPEGTHLIGAYTAIGRIAYIFMLESFVFISGYVWAYQHEQRGIETFGELVKKKGKRLLLPCWLFGVLYALLFGWDTSLAENILSVITGIGHLWFLFMLFACFVLTWAIVSVVLNYLCMQWLVIICLSALSICSIYHLPFQLSNIMYYLLFFFIGYVTFGHREAITAKTKGFHVVLVWISFLLLYIVLSYARSLMATYLDEGPVVEILKKGCRLGYTIAGMFAFYLTAVYAVQKVNLSQRYINLGTMCFGVYIFQQFVLHFLYYSIPLPSMVNSWVLPWLSFAIAVAVSLGLTYLLRITKFGRQIL